MLGANLKYPPGLLQDLDNLLAFLNGERERLFAINVLSCLHSFNCNLRMPMVGGHDRDNIDVFAIEDLTIIFVFVSSAALNICDPLLGPSAVIGIDITNCDTVSEGHGIGTNGIPTTARTDAAEDRPFVLPKGRRMDRLGIEVRNHPGRSGSCRCGFKKISTLCSQLAHHVLLAKKGKFKIIIENGVH